MPITIEPNAIRRVGDWHLERTPFGYVVLHPTFGPIARFADRRDALAYAYRTQAKDQADRMMAG